MLSAMNMTPRFEDPPLLWLLAFSFGCYASVLACLVFARRLWRGGARNAALAEAGLLVALVLFFFVLESFGQVRIPFYNYPTAFLDSRAPLSFSAISVLRPGFHDNDEFRMCSEIIAALPLNLPVSIAFMEGSLAFAALWTARLLGASRLGIPLLTGLAALLVDSALDPVVATSFTPSTAAGNLVQHGYGMGLWRWVVVDGLGPDAFGIPLINYGVWFAGTVILVCVIELLRKVCGWDQTIHARCLDLPRARTTPRAAVGLWMMLFGMSLCVIAWSPDLSRLTTPMQQLVFYSTVIGALIYFLRTAHVVPRRESIYWELLVPLLFFLLFPMSYLIASGLFWTQPLLLASTVPFVALGLLYCFGPYVPWATRGTPGACVDQSVRTSFASMTQRGRTDQC
jgi:hypothetical protein